MTEPILPDSGSGGNPVTTHCDRLTWMLRLLSDVTVAEAETASGDRQEQATIRNMAGAVDVAFTPWRASAPATAGSLPVTRPREGPDPGACLVTMAAPTPAPDQPSLNAFSLPGT